MDTSDTTEVDAAIWLADWRRRVAELYAAWRSESAADPEGATERFRLARDGLFRTHPQSPLPRSARPSFAGVPYFGYDRQFRLTAVLEPLADDTNVGAVALPVSRGDRRAFRRAGRLHLGGPLAGAKLTVFWLDDYAGGLFLAFRDATSGDRTYAAGRYLLDTAKGADLGGQPGRAELLLDFNMAYHPSCVYDPRWSCPLAPPDNRIEAVVAAGERLPAEVVL